MRVASFEHNAAMAAKVAASIRKTGRLLLLGMGGSHAVGRAVEPLYRALGIDALALPLSEQLGQPLPLAGRTVLVTSQSGESAEVVRWFAEAGSAADIFGLTLEGGSFLARTAPCLVGAGGTELAFAATRSLTVTFALHLAILAALGEDPTAALDALDQPQDNDITHALAALEKVTTIVTSGRRLQGRCRSAGARPHRTVAASLLLARRRPVAAWTDGDARPENRRHPVSRQRPDSGTGDRHGHLRRRGRRAARHLRRSGQAPVAGAVTLSFKPASGLAAIFAMLPVAQRLMIAFADTRVDNAGTPVRSTKITRSE